MRGCYGLYFFGFSLEEERVEEERSREGERRG